MPIQLALIRHGDAPFHAIDSRRQLSPKGREEAIETANYLAQLNFQTDNIIHSGLDRARDTAEIIKNRLYPHISCEQSDQLAPQSPIQKWLHNLMVWESNLILISHMPYLPLLLEELVGKRVFFPTAGCVIIEKQNSDDLNWKLSQSNF